MIINGIGTIFCGGRGVDVYRDALRQGLIQSEETRVSFQDEPFFACCIPDDALRDKRLSKKMRRADRFNKMAVCGAYEALVDAEVDTDRCRTGIILATALGPFDTTFRFLDDIREFGDTKASPTIFSHSVHNAAASYMATTLELQGPALTLTDFFFSFHHALLTAQLWLKENRCDQVLVGCVDEMDTIMQYVCSQKLHIASDGVIHPFEFASSPEAIPGEGVVFFLLSKERTAHSYAQVSDIQFGHKPAQCPVDILLVETDGLISDESIYLKDTMGIPMGGYAPVFGSIMSGSGFHAVAAALMLKEQKGFPNPVEENPRNIPNLDPQQVAEIRAVQAVRYNCKGRKASVVLSRMSA